MRKGSFFRAETEQKPSEPPGLSFLCESAGSACPARSARPECPFPEKILRGSATLKFDRENADKPLILDSRDLKISRRKRRRMETHGRQLRFRSARPIKFSASPLTIELPAHGIQVRVFYETVPSASGLQWLTPSRPPGRSTHSFTHNQRQFTPGAGFRLQDSPGVRVTYSATIRVPKGYAQ